VPDCAAFHSLPLDGHLRNLHAELASDMENFNIEGKSVDPH
jgi:hypothetical protein